jgi:hypothetical protein
MTVSLVYARWGGASVVVVDDDDVAMASSYCILSINVRKKSVVQASVTSANMKLIVGGVEAVKVAMEAVEEAADSDMFRVGYCCCLHSISEWLLLLILLLHHLHCHHCCC